MKTIVHRLYGVDPVVESRLKERGIKDSDDLLKQCRCQRDLAELAQFAGVEVGTMARLVHRADLARIRGIGQTYTRLLEEAGVSTMAQLATACPEDLRAQLRSINTQKRLVGRVPALAMVNGWVTKARRLPKTFDGASPN